MISVIMPVYNVESTLERAVQSVLEQTYSDFELLLVDDGSTDRSGRLCDELGQKDARIRVFHKPNGGLSSARNYGIQEAKREFLAFIDSDDYYEKDIFESFERERSEQTDLFVFNIKRMNGHEEFPLKSCSLQDIDRESALKALFHYSGAEFYAWNKIYRRDLFAGVEYPEGHLYEDVYTTYSYLKKCQQVTISDHYGYYYIQNPTSIVSSSFSEKQYDNVWQRLKLLEDVEVTFPNLVNEAVNKVVDGYLSTGFKLSQSIPDDLTAEYLTLLRQQIQKTRLRYGHQVSIPWQKRLALRILDFNSNIYGFLYKTYLGK
ncbi:glycosyltransferase family 2 protein [Aerococcus christensenii]|uniref:glycosyltransferase family 2 protein n=1 Tax=Aerococcus christensenii TaxID=87541 RepID=UPI0007633275|nr:glycosyltransferase family 2 protein [Aerococcus christensenii]AMB92168.1 hypothetical protein AWM71_02005 [Aerococcus christensenii]